MDNKLAEVLKNFKHLKAVELVNGLRTAAFLVSWFTGTDGIAILRSGRKAFGLIGLHSVGQFVSSHIKAELWADD